MLEIIDRRVKELLSQKPKDIAPLEILLMDDAFCAMMMRHRILQGVNLPEQNAEIKTSGRLTYLHALAAGEEVAHARAVCDGTEEILKRLDRFKAVENKEIREALLESTEAMMRPEALNSYWAGIYLLQGEPRIAQSSIPLHEAETSLEKASEIVMSALKRQPDLSMTLIDNDPVTDATGFIRIGRDPAHFAFPETGSVKAGTNAAILHYEIDHPGGDFVFFNSMENGDRLSDMGSDLSDRCPLYINDPKQMMALNSYYLQSLGAFRVSACDTQISILMRGGVLTAAERPDFSPDADQILTSLQDRGEDEGGLAAVAHYLREGEEREDDEWDVIEAMIVRHPDLLGHTGMSVERPQVFGIPKVKLWELALTLWDGDEGRAEKDVSQLLQESQVLYLPAGRHNLYVPNLSSTRIDQAIGAFNATSGYEDRDVIFVMSDRELDFGDDPNLVFTMRRLPEKETEIEAEPDFQP